MAAINRQDIISDDVFTAFAQLEVQLREIIGSVSQLGKNSGAKQMADDTKQLTIAETELAKVKKQLNVTEGQSTKEYIEQKAALDNLRKSNRESVKDINSLNSAYDKLSRELDLTRKAYKDLAAAGQANTKEAKALLSQTQKLDNQLKSIDRTVGQSQRSVGKYSDALKGVATRMIGMIGAGYALVTMFKDAIKKIKDYSFANSTLNAILDKTSRQTAELRKQQKELGASTVFTATQVTKAQTELARLGLTMSQITALTPAILDGAVALGVDMAQAAELVAGQLNAYGLAADQGARVTDVLVQAANIGAFDFERLATSLGIVSPAAKAVGATIEQTTAILGAAVDANIDASTAATGLRNIFIELSDKGLTWDQAMNKIQTSTDKMKTANDLFGKRSAVVSLVIADNTEKINKNVEALNNAAGAAKRFATEQLNNLTGDITLLTSAWEGFILSLEDGEGPLASTARWLTQAATATVKWLSGGFDKFTQWKILINELNLSNENLNSTIKGTVDLLNKEKEGYKSLKSVSAREASEERQADYRKQIDYLIELGNQRAAATEVVKKSEIVIGKETDGIKDNSKAVEENRQAWERLMKAIGKLDRIVPGVMSKYNENLMELSNNIFGKSGADNQKNLDESAKKYIKSIADRIKKTGEISKKAREDELDQEKAQQELRQEILTDAAQSSGEIFSSYMQLRNQFIDQEIEKLEFARNRELEAAGDNARLKNEIDKKYDAKRKDLQKRQAQNEKANALFQIAINTAVGVAKAIPNIPLVAIAAALGAAQAAFVLAQPLPKFDKGTESTPDTYIAGEKRPELRKSKGKWELVDKPTLFTGSRGDKIVSGKQTDSILGSLADIAGDDILTDKRKLLGLLNNEIRPERKSENLGYILQRNNDELIRTIQNKKEVSVTVNNKSSNVREKSGNIIINRIDYYYRR